MTLDKGRHPGAYEISDPLGAGGMGEVYCASEAILSRSGGPAAGK